MRGIRRTGRRVKNLTTGVVYQSCRAAARDYGVSPVTIQAAAENGWRCGYGVRGTGHFWKYVSKGE